MEFLTVGEVAQRSGLPVSTLHFWEAKGLIRSVRSDGNQRRFARAELRRIAPDGGSYVSESNYFNSSWQDAFWGSNYPRLREVKAKYDPDGLFFVHHGVGSEEWSADGFARR